jgi:hypothetical protein
MNPRRRDLHQHILQAPSRSLTTATGQNGPPNVKNRGSRGKVSR